MSYVNAKEGTGVRARGDLSPNLRSKSDTTAPLTSEQLVRAAQFLNGLTVQAAERNSTHVFVPVHGAKRLVDALLSASQVMEAKG